MDAHLLDSIDSKGSTLKKNIERYISLNLNKHFFPKRGIKHFPSFRNDLDDVGRSFVKE